MQGRIAHILFFPFHPLSTERSIACLQDSCTLIDGGFKVLQGENATAEQCCRDEGFPRVSINGAECNVCSKLIPSLCAIVHVTLHVRAHTHTQHIHTTCSMHTRTHTHTNTVCCRGNGLLCPHIHNIACLLWCDLLKMPIGLLLPLFAFGCTARYPPLFLPCT